MPNIVYFDELDSRHCRLLSREMPSIKSDVPPFVFLVDQIEQQVITSRDYLIRVAANRSAYATKR